MSNGDDIPFSKKGEREISPFIGQELLYDYITLQLDPERSIAVENYVKSNRSAQVEIQKINNGLTYCDYLSEVEVSRSLIDNIKIPVGYFQVLLQKLNFQKWPIGLKLGLESLLVSSVVILISIFVPWNKILNIQFFQKSDVVVSEINSQYSKETVEIEIPKKEAEKNESQTTVVFEDESAGSGAKPILPAPTAAAVAATPPQTAVPSQTVTPSPATTPVKAIPTLAATAVKAVAAATPVAVEKDKKTGGFLYRGVLKVVNAPANSPKLVQIVKDFGGRKAGEVELGWTKGSGSYFHFTMPEAKYEQLQAAFKEYGDLNLIKEKHDRIMPDGIIRLIIDVVESDKPKQPAKLEPKSQEDNPIPAPEEASP